MTSASAIGRVHDARDDVAVLSGAIGAEDGDRQHGDARVGGARDAEAVIGLGRDDAGHPGAVAVRIGQRVRAGKGGPAGQDDAVEVGVIRLDAGVEDRDRRRAGDGRRAVELVPADLGQRPLIRVRGVGRSSSGVANPIGLDAEHLRRGDQRRELSADGVGVEGDAADRELRDRLDVGGAGRVEDLELARRGRAGGEGDQVRDRLAGGGRRRRRLRGCRGVPRVGSGVGSGVAAGVGSGVASGVGSAVGSGVGSGVASGAADSVGLGSGVGSSARVAVGPKMYVTNTRSWRTTRAVRPGRRVAPDGTGNSYPSDVSSLGGSRARGSPN